MNPARWRQGRQQVWFGHQLEPPRLIWRVMSTMALLGFLLQFVLSGFGLLGLVPPPREDRPPPQWVHDGSRLFAPLPPDGKRRHGARPDHRWPPSGTVEPHPQPGPANPDLPHRRGR